MSSRKKSWSYPSLYCDTKFSDKMFMTKDVMNGVAKMIKENTKPYAPGGQSYLVEEYGDLTNENWIESGGYGTIYEIWSERLRKLVTVKVMSVKKASEKVVTGASSSTRREYLLQVFLRMCQEAVLQSDVLDHENVVKVHDKWLQYVTSETGEGLTPEKITKIVKNLNFGSFELTAELQAALDATEDLEVCLCTDISDGMLGEWLEHEYKPQEVSNIVLSIVRGLAYAHEHGYTHNDIKLENIVFQRRDNGSVMVALDDFGLASKIIERSYPVTSDPFRHHPIKPVSEEMKSVREELKCVADVTCKLKKHRTITKEMWLTLHHVSLLPNFILATHFSCIDRLVEMCDKYEREQNYDSAKSLTSLSLRQKSNCYKTGKNSLAEFQAPANYNCSQPGNIPRKCQRRSSW